MALPPLKLPAGSVRLAVEPSPAELARLRSQVRQWLSTSTLREHQRADVVLVVSELVAAAVLTTAPQRPIEVRCRYTHHLAVVEVDSSDPTHQLSRDEGLWAGNELTERLLRLFTARVVVASHPSGMVVRATITCDV